MTTTATIYQFPNRTGESEHQLFNNGGVVANGDYPDLRTELILDEIRTAGDPSAIADVKTARALISLAAGHRDKILTLS